jgi:hypothetical protein
MLLSIARTSVCSVVFSKEISLIVVKSIPFLEIYENRGIVYRPVGKNDNPDSDNVAKDVCLPTGLYPKFETSLLIFSYKDAVVKVDSVDVVFK